jgi:RNA polymerase sigma-70 factor (ECF subfamily)
MDGDGFQGDLKESGLGSELDKLLEGVARGEHGAFDLVYKRLAGPVYGLIRQVLRDPDQSQEVSQEVLLEIWRTAARYDPGKGSAVAWALMIAHRRAVDRVRHVAARTAREQRAAIPAALWDQVGDAVLDTLDHEQLHRCLDQLSYLQGQAIVLAFYGGYTYAQAAAMLEVPVGTLKARIRDALISLRKLMQPPG